MVAENGFFEDISSKLLDLVCENPLIFLVVVFFLTIVLILEIYEYAKYWKTSRFCRPTYNYDEVNGPIAWRQQFPDAGGFQQSPINLSRKASTGITCPALIWSTEYLESPAEAKIENDGHTVVMTWQWNRALPKVQGGQLKSPYELCAMRFRWGTVNHEGSEHTIDYRRYAMELQAVHTISEGCRIYGAPKLLIISYVFEVTSVSNPFLEPVVKNLPNIRKPRSSCSLPRFPVSWLMPAFASGYFLYTGSLTFPPCSEGVLWIVQREPLSISDKQVRQFRKLRTSGGYMLKNCRPTQNANDRDVYYHLEVKN